MDDSCRYRRVCDAHTSDCYYFDQVTPCEKFKPFWGLKQWFRLQPTDCVSKLFVKGSPEGAQCEDCK